MPTPTYTPLANITLGSSAASVTFSSISQAYRDLVLVIVGRSSVTTSASDDTKLNFNTGGLYPMVNMSGDGTSATTSSASGPSTMDFGPLSTSYSGNTANSQVVMNIMDYSATDKHKTVLIRHDNKLRTTAEVSRWNQTAAITSILLDLTDGNFVVGSTFALYGVAA